MAARLLKWLGTGGCRSLAVLLVGGIRLAAAPRILQPPVDTTALEGERATFAVRAEGANPLRYQWYRQGTAVTGADQATLTVGPLSVAQDQDRFFVTVADATGAVESERVSLTVAPGIEVVLSANHQTELAHYPGWPLVFEVALLAPETFGANTNPFLIGGPSGPWFSALQLELRTAAGVRLAWPLHAATHTNEVVRLEAATGARMWWWLTPEETQALPPGDYQASVLLDTTGARSAAVWKGVRRSAPVRFRILPVPSTPDEAFIEQQQLLRADFANLLGEPAAEREAVQALLAAWPANIGGLTYDAQLQMAAGRFEAARQSLLTALDQVARQSSDEPEAPEYLLAMLSSLPESVPPTALDLTYADGAWVLSWAAGGGAGDQLETSEDLRTWAASTATVETRNGRFQVRIQPTQQRLFFRLRRL